MTNTTVNGDSYAPADGESLLSLVATWSNRALNDDGTPADGGNLGVAVAVDSSVVPRSRWSQTPVAGQVDIVTAVQGG